MSLLVTNDRIMSLYDFMNQTVVKFLKSLMIIEACELFNFKFLIFNDHHQLFNIRCSNIRALKNESF